ncbi:hypothetical protein ANCDUO_19364 [Ancylostoma duodenale]|uniref:Uncharacterized protein n=1 Tax=Ancylostoma duodenale TaxID=51022 RepID=A0A0C2CL79_9BILA|nr:hypothetical protein ANCDUO_19364 [Ancylostoma duodenale]
MAFETNYPIPYRSKLTEPFEPGQTLTVKGKTGEDSVRWVLSLPYFTLLTATPQAPEARGVTSTRTYLRVCV